MLSLLRHPLTLTILILAAIVGWISFIFVVNRSDQDLERANQATVELEQNMTELQAQLNELQADHEGLLQETIALRMLSESGETTEESAVASAEEIISRFPGGRESYLAARLKQAAKQLRRQRAQNRQLTLSLSEAGERNAANMVDSEERAAQNEQLNGELDSAKAESPVMREESQSPVSADERVSRFPYGRETYLATRLKHATRQIRRQRALNRHLASSLEEANERMAVELAETDSLSSEKPVDSSSMTEEAQASVMAEDSRTPTVAERIANLQQELEFARNEMLQLDVDLSAALYRITTLEQELETARSEKQQTDARLSAATNRVASLENELETINNERQRLDTELSATLTRVASLQQELESANNEQQQLDTNLAVVESRIAGLEPELESVRSEQQQSESELSAATDQVTGLEQMLQTARTERQRLDAELSVAQTRIASLEQQLENAKAQIQQTESEPSATAGQIAALEPELDIASDEKQRTVKEIERLTAQIDELRSGYDSERAYYERTIEGLVEKLNQAVALVAGSEDQGESATQMADSEETDSTQDQDSSETLLADRTSQLLARLSDLQERLSQTEVSASALSDAESRVAELDLQLSDSISQNVQMQEELINLTNQVDSLTTELQAAERRTENMETLAQSITKENEQLGQLIGDLRKTMDISIAEKASEISELVSGYTVLEYSTDILFESGSAVLTEAGKEDLKEFAKSIESESFNNRVVSVEGHTDNVPIKGDLRIYYPTNWELSMARSAAATRYLVEQGVPADRLRAVGFGSRRPIEPNDTESGRRSNRRIEIHLVPELQKAKN
ncbi:MAG: OmpA family protein [Gammaproteobacteria bacterium]|nr:OmpA family protein [Gammaproteobacteria bacterium]